MAKSIAPGAHGRPAAWRTTASLSFALAMAGCQDGYPIAATRCDRACNMERGSQCREYNPVGCVVGCEQLAGGPACYPAFDELLACLEAHQVKVCGNVVDSSFIACSAEQAELYACAKPDAPQGPSAGE